MAKPGTVTALVGPTGAGKTTLCYLLARLYDVERSAVRLDGVDIREIAFDWLTAAIAMVPQEPHLFHDSVIANLRYARPQASAADVTEACRKARIHRLIESLSNGHDTLTGERGYRFPAVKNNGSRLLAPSSRIPGFSSLMKPPPISTLRQRRWNRRGLPQPVSEWSHVHWTTCKGAPSRHRR